MANAKLEIVPEINPIDEYVGSRVRERRQKLGWTLVDLAEKLGVSHQQIQKYEQGVTRISASILFQLSQIFKTSQDYFFEGYNPVHGLKSLTGGTIDLNTKREINIVLVEDDPADELLARKALEECNFKVNIHALHDGEQAIQFLRREQGRSNSFPRPDLILLDLNIPKRDGHMVLREIRRDRDIQDIPVVILTNSINREEMISVYKNAASGYVCKSFDYETFKHHMRNIINYWGETAILPNMN